MDFKWEPVWDEISERMLENALREVARLEAQRAYTQRWKVRKLFIRQG